MAVVRMFITKFDKEVLIDEDHPLAVAEKAKPKRAPRRKRAEGSES